MKILILSNFCDWKSWDAKIKALKDWWAPEVELDIILEQSVFKNIPWIDYTSPDGRKFKGIEQVWYDENISTPALDRGFDCVVLTVAEKDWPDLKVEGWNTPNNLGVHEIQAIGRENANYRFNGVKYEGDQWFNIVRHELSHAIYLSRGITDNTHKWWQAGNLAEVKKELAGGFIGSPLVLAFRRLLIPPMTYKYFNQSEIEGLKPELCKMLDVARGLAGTSFIITSGFRTTEQNRRVGGKPNSAHLTGKAVDILCKDNFKRDMILRGIYGTKVPCFVEIAQSHIHVDVGENHQLGQTMISEDD